MRSAAGFVDVASLKATHFAMHSGLVAARALHWAWPRRVISIGIARALTSRASVGSLR